MVQQQRTTEFDLGALNERIDGRALREFRRRFAAPRTHPVARVLGFLGTVAIILLLGLYISGWQLALLPWLTIAVAILWFIAWVIGRRAKRRRLRLRYRLSRLAAANALTAEFDRRDKMPARLAALGTDASKSVILIRLRSALQPAEASQIESSDAPAATRGPRRTLRCLEIGLHAHEAPMSHSSSASTTALTAYVLLADDFDAAASLTPPSNRAPETTIGPTDEEAVVRYDLADEVKIAYLADQADFGNPSTWRRLQNVANWLIEA